MALTANDAESVLMHMAQHRSSCHSLFYPSLESEVVGPYMASRRRHHTDEKWIQLVYGMHTSHTLYVGNLSFYTREEQLHELFSRIAPVSRIIMGLNSNTRTPCGFAFVEFTTHRDARLASVLLSGHRLDDRILKIDLDAAFEEGRQYGRGRSGGQITDDHRDDFDAARGGWGTIEQARKERAEAAERVRNEQTDEFGGDHSQQMSNDGGPSFDPDTYGGGYERPRTSTIFNIDRPLKLSQSTLATVLPGVFPHYNLPLDDRVKAAIREHVKEMNGDAESVENSMQDVSNTGATDYDAATRAFDENDDRNQPTPPPPDHDHDDSNSRSPATKRARHTSPPSSHGGSRSPQPLAVSNQQHSSSHNNYHDDDDDDRTPPPNDDDDDRTPQHLDEYSSSNGHNNNNRSDNHRDNTRMADVDEDPDATPKHLPAVDDDPDATPKQLDDDDATPKPETHPFKPDTSTDPNQPDFDAFEK